jgi:hypothetical protein
MMFQKVKNLLSLNHPVKQLRNKTTMTMTLVLVLVMVMVMVIVLKPKAPMNTTNTWNLSIHF